MHGPSISWAPSGKIVRRRFYENDKKLNWFKTMLAFRKLNHNAGLPE
jgi:hypothetical protein